MTEIWHKTKEKMRQKVSKPAFETWIANTSAELDNDVLTIYCENEFQREWLDAHYKDSIFYTIREITGETYELFFKTTSANTPVSTPVKKEKSSREIIKLLEEKIISLETTVKKLENRLNALEQKTQLEK